jgi:hypothetical protein
MKSSVSRLFQKHTYLGCLLEDKQKIFHIKKQLLQPLQALLGARSCCHLLHLLRLEYQYLQLLFLTSNQQLEQN